MILNRYILISYFNTKIHFIFNFLSPVVSYNLITSQVLIFVINIDFLCSNMKRKNILAQQKSYITYQNHNLLLINKFSSYVIHYQISFHNSHPSEQQHMISYFFYFPYLSVKKMILFLHFLLILDNNNKLHNSQFS